MNSNGPEMRAAELEEELDAERARADKLAEALRFVLPPRSWRGGFDNARDLAVEALAAHDAARKERR